MFNYGLEGALDRRVGGIQIDGLLELDDGLVQLAFLQEVPALL